MNLRRFPLSWCARLRISGMIFGFSLAASAEPAEPTHPVLSVSGSGSAANGILSSYTEAQFLEFVPQQSPRDDSFLATVVPGDTGWSWSASAPNQLKSTPSNTVFPNASYNEKTETVAVLSGKTVSVPYYLAAGSTSKKAILQAYIDYRKRNQLRSFMTSLAVAYLQSGSSAATRDDRYARRAALALDAWATYVPDYYMTPKNSPSFISANGFTKLTSDIQRASDHNGMAHEWEDDTIEAFDAIYDSKALADLSAEKGYDVRRHIADGYFFNIGDYIKNRIPISLAINTNLSGAFTTLARVARVLNRPDYIVWMRDYLDATVRQKIMRDGVLGEGISYSTGYLNENIDAARSTRDYFLTRPAETPELATIQTSASGYATIMQSGLNNWAAVRLPNGELPAFGDTTFGASGARNAGNSALLPAYGHASLGAGTGAEAVQLNQNFPDDANHMRADVGAFVLWALNTELLGNIRYFNPTPGRQFGEQILSHNAVTIDRVNMDRSGWNVGGRDHVFTSGNLTLYEPGNQGLAATEIDGQRAYANKATRYQRIMILNTTDLSRPYVVDVFRITGGATHDYTLHGSIRFDQTGEASFPLTADPATYPLLEGGEKWSEPTSSGSEFPYYGFFRNVSSGTAPANFQITFRDNGSSHRDVRLWVTNQAGATVHLARTPNPERSNGEPANFYKYWRPSVIVRRRVASGPLDSVFANVVEPLRGGVSTIQNVEQLPIAGGGLDAVALRITFTDGRVDTCLVNLNNPNVVGASSGSTTVATADGALRLTGRIGVRTENAAGIGRLWTIGAGDFQASGRRLAPTTPVFSGTITGVVRKATGAASDGFITDALLPLGTALQGRQLSLRYSSYQVVGSTKTQAGISEMFQIDHVEPLDGQTLVVLTNDPQLQMDGDRTTELMAPQRAFTGPNRFEIITSASLAFSASRGPAVTAHPLSQTLAPGGRVTLSVQANGSGALSYQWTKDGVALPGATNATLTWDNAAASDSGDYQALVIDADGGSTTTRFARVVIASPDPGRIINLSVRASAGAGGQPLIGGFVVSGGAKPMLVRGVGPQLGLFGVAGVMTDPRLEIHASVDNRDTIVATNDNWVEAGQGSLESMFTRTGAFPLANATTKDAALIHTADGGRTVHIGGVNSATGVVLMEVYDGGEGNAARLTNVSSRNRVGTGADVLIAGFVISGNTPKRLLVRGVGPRLADFGVTGVLADPKLELHTTIANQDVTVASNDNWSDEPNAADVATIPGPGFGLQPGSKDAALLITLPAGSYTAVVSGANSSVGEALVEIYDLPE